jgi:hypothetical protein
MKVICVSNTKRLVKGAIYEVEKIMANPTPLGKGRMRSKYIYIDINGSIYKFVTNKFKTEDGKDIPSIDWVSDRYRESELQSKYINRIKNTIKSGDYVICLSNHHKYLVYGNKYRISEVDIQTVSLSWGNFDAIRIKLEGDDKFYSSNSFRCCTIQESRDTSLRVVFGETTEIKKPLSKFDRKIDQYDEESKFEKLIRTVMLSYIDPNRNNMSVIDWACKKTQPTLSIRPDDFKEILEMKLKEILEK